MQPPIVVVESGDICVFPSVDAAARYLEPVDVRNGEYVAYDSAGFLLKLVPTEPVVSIPGYLSSRSRQGQLAEVLRLYLSRVSIEPILTETRSLDDLLSIHVSRFGYTE
ncbi:hypothetical protein [Marilutibacter spongiae]|uniref:Uncharacterized protein n=1 Tax=Marilutibacter spongiae TaxID=2025720 RepID=A0A7W3TPP6_9GAMM|nr:hypothetical protein [Lysobacter spongiae]MBB1062172.1 hypothetical protein [Lysobacter spongiae]